MRANRVLAPVLTLILVAGVAVAGFVSFQRQRVQTALGAVVAVTGLVGSEKKAYLADPRVLAVLRRNGIDLHVETAGSRDMTTRTDLRNYDFVFPAGVPAAKKLIALTHASTSYSPFYTPMAVASWKPIATILMAGGIVRKVGADYYIVDMHRLVDLMAARERWNQLPQHDAYDVGKSILISSTDVTTSNSAAMYLSLATYLLNGNAVVQDESQVRAVLPKASQLFLRQGYQEASSAGPFDDYTTIGMGKSPLVMVYEAQFLEYAIGQQGARDPNMVLLYPKPTVFTKHEFVPLDAKGDKVGALLQNDPDLQHLANEHGLRTADPAYARTFWRKSGVHAPDTIIDVVDPPSYDVLETMIRAIGKASVAASP
jgi:hypothetical protein